MEKVIKFLDSWLSFMYSSSLSVMDVMMIMIISVLAVDFHWAIWFLLVPWILYSSKQSLKYKK